MDTTQDGDGFDAAYFKNLAKLEAGNFWFRSRNRLLIWALRSYFPDARRFLEIGCGTGFVLQGIQRDFRGLELSGSEIFEEGLAFADQRLPGVPFFQMDARRIPFENEFDVIGAFDVLEHIERDEDVLAQMFQACKPGGGIMITVPQHRFLWSVLDDYSFHKRRYSKRDLVEKIERAGFTILRATSFVFLLLPMLFLSRLKKRMVTANFNATAELQIGSPWNEILESIMSVERFLIEQNVSLPLGGSLLLIARKKNQ